MTTPTLYYSPIIHSQSEMGALGNSIMKVTQQKLGEGVWQRKLHLVEQFWSSIEEIVFGTLSLPYARTRVYQDGLPVCDKEAEIVAKIAAMGSPNLQKLFDPFYTTSSVGNGTGLGLSICYSVVKQHAGSIAVESSEGQGSIFTVKLPLCNG